MSILFIFKSQKGMALIMVLSIVMFVIVLIQQTIFETKIEYRSAVHELNSLRAYHAAKSGMAINILRLKIYRQIITKYSTQISPFRSYVNLIWQFPFQWPPPKITSFTSDKTSSEKSFMNTSFITSLKPTVGQIDINDLASPIPSLRLWTHMMLYRLIHFWQNTNEHLDEEDKLSDLEISTLLYNIQDWVDPDTQQAPQNILSENTVYSSPPLPSNHSFLNIEELQQVSGMSNNIYKMLVPFITTYGEKGLDINTAPTELIQALHANFPIEVAQEIKELTSNLLSPFNFTRSSFSQFLTKKGLLKIKQHLFPDSSEKNNIPISYIYFSSQHNFTMKSIGIAGKSQKTITAVYFDTNSVKTRFKTLLKAEKKREQDKLDAIQNHNNIRTTNNTKPNKPPDPSPPKQNNAPIIIYWKENL